MIKNFLSNKTTFILENSFGKFVYDIDVYRSLPRKDFFDKKIAKEILTILFKVAEDIDLKLFLIFGTCLGAVRDKNFIDNDLDIDIGAYKRDIKEIIILIKNLVDKYDFKILKISLIEESITLVYNNIIVDIGFYTEKKKFYIYNDFYQNKIPKVHLSILDQIYFLDILCFIPHDVNKYLAHQYGKNWREPVQEWNYFNKYISKEKLEFLQKIKRTLKNEIKNIRYKILLIREKKLFLNVLLNQLNIKNIKSISKSGQGFCDTYIIKSNQNIVIKKNNQKRFDYFNENFTLVEPIYIFLEYSDRFKHEKLLFEKLNKKEVEIRDDIIIFPFLESTPLSDFLYHDKFFFYLKQAINILKDNNLRHGDFHIENILISSDSQVYLIDFEMTFSNFLSEEEQFYYDIYYFFAKLEYQYSKFFDENYSRLQLFIKESFSPIERKKIITVSNKTKKYFFSVNGARVELFR